MKKLDLLMGIEFDKEWSTKDLYNKINEYFIDADRDYFKEEYYGYIMTVHGWYNKALCDDNRFRGLLRYAKEDFNSLLNDKEDCLYIISNYPDFKSYEVYKVSFENRTNEFTSIKVYGIRRSIFSKLLYKIFIKLL